MQQTGAVVSDVAPGSPAAQAGLRAQDIITKIDSKDLTDESSLAAALASHKPGDKVSLSVDRGGSEQQISVTLGNAPS
jgi:S1-C subfamily serine protease